MTLRRPEWGIWVAWHAAALLCLVVALPRARYGGGWTANGDVVWLVTGLAAMYAAGALALSLYTARSAVLRFAEWFVCVASPAGLYLLFLSVTEHSFPRLLLAAALAGYPVAMGLLLILPRVAQLVSVGGAAATIAASLILVREPAGRVPSDSTALLRTPQATFLATTHRNYWDSVTVLGGGLAELGNAYLLARADGELFRLSWDSTRRSLDVAPSANAVPMNRAAMLAAAELITGERTDVFRVGDLLVERRDSVFDVFVSHHYWNDAGKCVVVRVSATSGTARELLDSERPWRTLYESRPCLPLVVDGRSLASQQMGGALVRFSANELLLTLGDHGFDGVRHTTFFSQNDTASYGKTVRVNLTTGTATTHSIGHRNPQGLLVAADGTIWATEHGPSGGDELNRILPGRNYGWPLVTLGVDYEAPVWPLTATPGRHDGYEPPVFAWRPSVGTTSVVQLRHPRWADWQNDLIVATMVDQSLWHVRLDNNRVTYTERISTDGARVRDAILDSHGRLVLLIEGNYVAPTTLAIAVVEPLNGTGKEALDAITDPVLRGEILFRGCIACHSVLRHEPRATGPSLWRVFNRRKAALPTFSYSAALRGLGGKWTTAALDAFIADPAGVAPGTAMGIAGISDPADRAAIIAYLRTLR